LPALVFIAAMTAGLVLQNIISRKR
jgi:hypothetical protein